MQKIITHPQGSYPLMLAPGALDELSTMVDNSRPLAIISDSHVAPLYAHKLGVSAPLLTIPAGEESKTLATVATLYEQLLDHHFDRTGVIIALGGGVVGDIAGFVAATFMRGVKFINCPTSLLAMVDASIGGKTGVDLPQGKNLVGAFKQPTAVIADTTTLATLPAAEWSSGMAEVLKSALIGDATLWSQLATISSKSDITPFIMAAVSVKQRLVEADPYEQGVRAWLNLGHTFGHAIEQLSGYQVRHGEGVGLGLVAAAHLSAQLGHCPPTLVDEIRQRLRQVGLPVTIPTEFDPVDLYAAMYHDKKKRGKLIRFVLLRGVGELFVSGASDETAVTQAAVLKTLRACQSSSI